jgi:hypothetical protein
MSCENVMVICPNTSLSILKEEGKYLVIFSQLQVFFGILNQEQNVDGLFWIHYVTGVWQVCGWPILDSLYFSDHFSYINYFHLTYGLFSMNFQSLFEFLEFPDLFLIKKS